MREMVRGGAVNRPRDRVRIPGATLHMLGAALPSQGVVGMKCYLTVRAGARFHVLLYGIETGELLVVMEADRLGQQRTGAASGVATRAMARPDADVMTLFGAGWQGAIERREVRRCLLSLQRHGEQDAERRGLAPHRCTGE